MLRKVTDIVRKRLAYSLPMNLDSSKVLKGYETFSFGFVYGAFALDTARGVSCFRIFNTGCPEPIGNIS